MLQYLWPGLWQFTRIVSAQSDCCFTWESMSWPARLSERPSQWQEELPTLCEVQLRCSYSKHLRSTSRCQIAHSLMWNSWSWNESANQGTVWGVELSTGSQLLVSGKWVEKLSGSAGRHFCCYFVKLSVQNNRSEDNNHVLAHGRCCQYTVFSSLSVIQSIKCMCNMRKLDSLTHVKRNIIPAVYTEIHTHILIVM